MNTIYRNNYKSILSDVHQYHKWHAEDDIKEYATITSWWNIWIEHSKVDGKECRQEVAEKTGEIAHYNPRP